MASASRRARRAKNRTMINLDSVLAKLNEAATELDSITQQIAGNPDSERAVVARLTQGVVLAGTAVEILGGLNNALKFVEENKTDDTTEE
jgi:hypothetical protein